MMRLRVHALLLGLSLVFAEGSLSRVLREVSRVHKASAPPPEAGGESDWGPRRALGRPSDCHPFLFLEDALLPRGQMPPFGRHPHAGLCTVTILFRGDHLKPWDSINGECPVVESGGLYVVHSGVEIVHAEDEVVHNEKDDSGYTHACFVWFDPGIWNGQLRLAHTQILHRHHIPEITQEGGLRLRVLLGEYQRKSALVDTHDAKILLLDCSVAAGSPQDVVMLPPSFESAFVYVPWHGGQGEFGATKVRISALEVGHVTGRGRALTVKNTGTGTLHCLIGAGESNGAVPSLLFGNNGGVAAQTEELAREAMQRFERSPLSFGAPASQFREDSRSPSPDPMPLYTRPDSISPPALP